MAGSWSHITDDEGRFRGTDLIDNLGDAYEALEECHGMVWYLAGWLHDVESHHGVPLTLPEYIETAVTNYRDGVLLSSEPDGGPVT